MPLRYGLIEPVDLGLPRLPRALEGLRIAHVSDLHVRRWHRPQPRRRLGRLINQLTALRLDLLLLTGDYQTRADDTDAALRVLNQLTRRVRPTLGAFGVFGNHDHPELVDACTAASTPEAPPSASRLQPAGPIPEARWLRNQATRLVHRDTPIDLLGLHTDAGTGPDSVALALDLAQHYARLGEPAWAPNDPDRPLRLLLTHFPSTLPTAADLGADAVFTGHTHGGQIRLPPGIVLENSSSLPLRLTTGLHRHRDTAAVISRGLGEMTLPFRLFCPPHAPLVTLRRQPLPGPTTDRTVRLWHW